MEEIKNSGKQVKFESGMVRDINQDKPRFDLVWPDCIPYKEGMEYRLAVHMAKGANHYGPRNWEKATGQEELDRFRESARRHFCQWYYGETDEDHSCGLFFNVTGFEMVKSKMKQNNIPDEIPPEDNEIFSEFEDEISRT